MSVRIIQDKLDSYHCKSTQEEDFALKEITQELVLNSLYNAGFFKRAAFHGGTALRILHGVMRFSEDLDFALVEPDPHFDLGTYLAAIPAELKAFGYDLKIAGRSSAGAVKSVFLKDDSLGRILNIRFPKLDGFRRSVKIKLEVDTNPPAGANVEMKFLDFPINYSVTAHDLPTLFAGKSHALLCREYTKGRDWFDFLWYVNRRVSPNFRFLSNALNQVGAWRDKEPNVDRNWYLKEVAKRIKKVKWDQAKADMERFLRPIDVKTLELWDEKFFLHNLSQWAELVLGTTNQPSPQV